MKKIFALALAAIMCASSAKALEYIPESGFTVQGLFGMNISNFRHPDAAFDGLTDPKAGFNLGVRGEYMLPSCYGVFVNLGVNYTMKGAKMDVAASLPDDYSCTVKFRPCYIEIPLHVGYRFNVLDNLGVFADFGPYFAIGVNGKEKTEFEGDAVEDRSTKFFRNSKMILGEIQRYDFGLGFRVGAEYANHHSLNFSFDWGLTDMYRDSYRREFFKENGFELGKLKNFNAGITYGYRF
ncbi:MAG: porin family protein [Paraprevotella sp.]|nr:porin family protein [Paraprevotella sp.]MDY5265688.1 porin family protein [Bacteroidaceae bacterium]